jgi:F420-dependent oxidoreductase-like protein
MQRCRELLRRRDERTCARGAAAVSVRIVAPSLVVLIGPSASGKSTWAGEHFEPHQVVSSDSLRALVGEGDHDMRASADAFEVLEDVVARRLKRGLLTVVDTLGLEAERRAAWQAIAAAHGVPCYAVAFDTPAAECKARNRKRRNQVPAKVLTQQLETFAASTLEGFAHVFAPGPVEVVPPAFARAADDAERQVTAPVGLRFGLQISHFDDIPRLGEIAAAAEEAGFASLWVMDHFIQIPQVGREWDAMLDSWTTLGYLGASTGRATLGTLVTGITYRNVAHVAKLAATLDVLSNGRAVCGVGAGWFEREHRAYGWPFPAIGDRYALLEDALRLFPLMWGPGSPEFTGKSIGRIETICYPRPLQERIPILVGGSGERRTLKLVARHADACNLFGDADTVRRKVGVLHEHCAAEGRDPAAIEVTHLAPILVGQDRRHVEHLLDKSVPAGASRHAYAASVNAGSIEDHIGRFRELADAGVQHAIVGIRDLNGPEPALRMKDVINAFST